MSILKNSEMESPESGSDSDSVISCHLHLDARGGSVCDNMNSRIFRRLQGNVATKETWMGGYDILCML